MVLSESVVHWDKQLAVNTRSAVGSGIESDILARWAAFDALTTFGIKLWTPETQAWREVSVKGCAFQPRLKSDTAGEKLRIDSGTMHSANDLGLEITDGSLIDLCGVVLLFQKPSTMASQKPVSKYSNLTNI